MLTSWFSWPKRSLRTLRVWWAFPTQRFFPTTIENMHILLFGEQIFIQSIFYSCLLQTKVLNIHTWLKVKIPVFIKSHSLIFIRKFSHTWCSKTEVHKKCDRVLQSIIRQIVIIFQNFNQPLNQPSINHWGLQVTPTTTLKNEFKKKINSSLSLAVLDLQIHVYTDEIACYFTLKFIKVEYIYTHLRLSFCRAPSTISLVMDSFSSLCRLSRRALNNSWFCAK